VVETARTAMALRMCQEAGQEPVRAMMQAQSDGSQVFTVTPTQPTSVQLVPWVKHETLLSSLQERYDVLEVFGNRLHQAIRAEWHHYKTVGSTNPSMIVLRPIVLAKPAKKKGGAQDTHLAFLVKLFCAPMEVGYMCGLKLHGLAWQTVPAFDIDMLCRCGVQPTNSGLDVALV